MSREKNSETSTESTVMSLDQLSDTIEVMTGVVNRLKRHLHSQLAQSDKDDKAEALNSALLSNERELQELQRLAKQQQHSIDLQLDASVQEANDTNNDNEQAATEQSIAKESCFIIEIAQQEEADDLSNDRVLH
jgi:hypothetical protein